MSNRTNTILPWPMDVSLRLNGLIADLDCTQRLRCSTGDESSARAACADFLLDVADVLRGEPDESDEGGIAEMVDAPDNALELLDALIESAGLGAAIPAMRAAIDLRCEPVPVEKRGLDEILLTEIQPTVERLRDECGMTGAEIAERLELI